MSEKPEALQAAESLEQAIQFYSAGLENSDNHMTLLAFAADKFRRLHAENERLNAVALQAQNAAIDLTKKNERLREALEMVRDADDDCKRDGLPTIPSPARRAIDAALRREDV